ncbi:heterokaryon incompatibility protein [Fusarium tjaetaba]|uniref:Heterokaryon incompatibility protein n=1 Tax=Fusarium tjaetaba TaxID=1567544 RepID=A0A8H5RPG6_9HYPO|nr:heterokaryon incompatibility protein [Fusarium tjaetaba]KAF5636720.1 heterokaryon incompatibility protein [Fusarium tjaetaba]
MCAFSVSVLQNDAVDFKPTLPRWKREAIQQIQMGTYTKIFMQFNEAFWPEDTQYFLYADPEQRGCYPLFWSLSTPGFIPGSNILFGTAVQQQAYEAEQQSDSKTKKEIMKVLRSMFPDKDVPEPTAFMLPDGVWKRGRTGPILTGPLIRLVRVLPPSPHDTRLSLDLRHGYIEDGTYSALSYVWGDASEQQYILVNRVLFRIRRNLYQALMQLRSNGVTGWLWIDSICIQQKNIDEKSYQVGMMREIFSSASRVYSWLGEGTLSTDAAMDFCARIGPKAFKIEIDKRFDAYLVSYLKKLFAYPKDPFHLNLEVIRPFVSKPELATFFVGLIQDTCLKPQKSGCNDISKGLYDMMGRTYWTRIWINQEVALAKSVLIMCGGKSASLEFIEQTLRSLELCSRLYRFMPLDASRDLFHMGSRGISIKLPILTRRLYQQGQKIPLSRLLCHGLSGPPPQLYTAADPRDLIFALLGVITENGKLGLKADYRLSVKEVFTVATRAMYECDTDRLDIDLCMPSEDRQDEIPSWVIDWRKGGPNGCQMWPINPTRTMYHASGNIDNPAPVFLDGDNQSGILRRYGYLADSITDVWQGGEDCSAYVPGESENENLRRISSIIDFVQLPETSGPSEDYVWRTLRSRDAALEDNHPKVRSLIRSVMRQESISSESLTASQIAYLDTVPLSFSESPNWTLAEKLPHAVDRIQRGAFFAMQGRSLFKTQKGMFGLGHEYIQPKDVVTLLFGTGPPIVLRPRDEGGFTFAGDAYVDGIMQGEFLQTNPVEQEFVIY